MLTSKVSLFIDLNLTPSGEQEAFHFSLKKSQKSLKNNTFCEDKTSVCVCVCVCVRVCVCVSIRDIEML